MDNNKNYYVYIWIREDYNTIFYVGKGKNDRAKTIKGNIQLLIQRVEQRRLKEKVYLQNKFLINSSEYNYLKK